MCKLLGVCGPKKYTLVLYILYKLYILYILNILYQGQGQGLFRNLALYRVYRNFIIHFIFIHCICVFVFCICMINNSTYHVRHSCTLCFPKKTLGWLNAYCKPKPYIFFQGTILSIASGCIDNYNTHNKLYSFVFI